MSARTARPGRRSRRAALWGLCVSSVLGVLLLPLPIGGQESAVEGEPSQVIEEELPQTVGGKLDLGRPVPGPESFVRASSAYEEGRYEDAIALYEALAEAGQGTGPVEYNLGNSYLRSGDLGRAIASYRRALAATPRDQDLLANLDFARKSAKDALAPPAPSPIVQTLFFWHFALSRGELLRVTAVLNVLFWLALGFVVARPDSELWRWTAVALAVLLAAAGGSLGVHTVLPQRVAVVLPQEVDVHSGLSHETVVRFKLHAGSEVAAREQRDGWVRIALPDGQQGWIEEGAVLVVEG